MGREIRRVKPGWVPPRDERGHIHPHFDKSYREACEEWDEGYRAWEPRDDCRWFWEWEGGPPEDERCYRPEWSEDEMTGWCLYETVSEGTPVTPIFDDAEGLIRHLAEHGEDWSDGGMGYERARAFVESGGWAPSFVMTPERGVQGGVDFMADEALARPTPASRASGAEGESR